MNPVGVEQKPVQKVNGAALAAREIPVLFVAQRKSLMSLDL